MKSTLKVVAHMEPDPYEPAEDYVLTAEFDDDEEGWEKATDMYWDWHNLIQVGGENFFEQFGKNGPYVKPARVLRLEFIAVAQK